MKIVYIQSRLGNQLFQYAFFLYLKKKGNKRVYLDTTAPFIKKYGGFEVKKIFPAVAKNAAIIPAWIARPFYLLGDVLKKVFKINLQTDNENPAGKKIWWKGYWQEFKYPEFVKEELKKEYVFLPVADEKNRTAMQLMSAPDTVSIHLRRGDYTHPDIRPIFGDICTPEYYHEAIEYIKEKVASPKFFVFSDDVQWAKENLHLPEAMYVDWNTGENNFRDMQLMSCCNHHIIANSSFSWWGAWLGDKENKLVVCPAKWFNNYPADFMEKLLPPSWHRIGIQKPNLSLILPDITAQELAPILNQDYADFELLANRPAGCCDKRIKPLTTMPTGNHIFEITETEIPLFTDRKYIEKKLKKHFKTWNN